MTEGRTFGMERKKKNSVVSKQQRAGSVFFRILTVLFVSVFSANCLTACGFAPKEEFLLEQESVESAAVTENTRQEETAYLYVHVCGAVNSPGLVRLPGGSRVFDALELAEGFAPEADTSAVNLAAMVTDGQQLYFPVVGEAVGEAFEETGRVNLNTADEKELCTLTGIGSSRAQAILEYRKRQGGFDSVEELMKVPGIKESVFEKICDKITVK